MFKFLSLCDDKPCEGYSEVAQDVYERTFARLLYLETFQIVIVFIAELTLTQDAAFPR
jgi:hypothetical protein